MRRPMPQEWGDGLLEASGSLACQSLPKMRYGTTRPSSRLLLIVIGAAVMLAGVPAFVSGSSPPLTSPGGSCWLAPGQSCTIPITLPANALVAIYGTLQLSSYELKGQIDVRTWWQLKAQDSYGTVISETSQNIPLWPNYYQTAQMLWVATDSRSGTAFLTILNYNTNDVTTHFYYGLNFASLQSRSNIGSGSYASTQTVPAGGSVCVFATPGSNAWGHLVSVWGRVTSLGSIPAQFVVYMIKYDGLSSNFIGDRFVDYQYGEPELDALYPVDSRGGSQLALCVANFWSSSETFTFRLFWEIMSGSVSPSFSSGSGSVAVSAYSSSGQISIYTATNTAKLYIGWLNLGLNGGDDIQYVNWEFNFANSHSQLYIDDWYSHYSSSDSAAYQPSSSSPFQTNIHNWDSVAQTFNYNWWVEYV